MASEYGQVRNGLVRRQTRSRRGLEALSFDRLRELGVRQLGGGLRRHRQRNRGSRTALHQHVADGVAHEVVNE